MNMIVSFALGLMLTPATLGLVVLMSYLDMHGYLTRSSLPAFGAGGILGVGCFVVIVLWCGAK